MSTFYSDLLSDVFFNKINKLKIEKGFINDTPKRKILNYTFIFINTDNCDCIYINQNELNIKEIKDFKITNIVVLLNTETEYAGYWNHNFNLIGIFDQRLKEENINFDSIAVSSFNITSMIHYGQYDGELITNFDVVFIENPFEKHIKNALKPVKKAINKNIPKQMNFTSSFEDVMDNVNIHQRMALSSTYNIRRFKDFLLDVKELDENISNNLFNKYGTSKFNPEDYKD
mgnify:CR=1 FL=1